MTDMERIDAAEKWMDEIGHLPYCMAICGPEGLEYVVEEKCDKMDAQRTSKPYSPPCAFKRRLWGRSARECTTQVFM